MKKGTFTLKPLAHAILSAGVLLATPALAQEALPEQAAPSEQALYDQRLAQEQAQLDQRREQIRRMIEEDRKLDELRAMLRHNAQDRAVDERIENAVPMSAEDIIRLRLQVLETQKATQRPLGPPPKSIINTVDLDIDNPSPLVVHVASGYASSLVFFDLTGAPWPVESVVVGDSTSFNAQVITEAKNIIAINVIRHFAQGNILVNLIDLPMPVVVSLRGDDHSLHARLNVRLPKFGPHASPSITAEQVVDNAPPELLDILSGHIPTGAIRRALQGIHGDAWELNGEIYIRTEAMLLSPAWKKSAQSPSGIRVYQVGGASRFLFSVNGQRHQATLGEPAVAHR